MDCILLRHGIAVACEDWNGPESERPLTKEGIQKTRKAIAGLKQIGIKPTHLLSSPFTRALETAEIVAEMFHLDPDFQVCEELLFHRSPVDLFPVLGKFPEPSCVVCVGHEPHLRSNCRHDGVWEKIGWAFHSRRQEHVEYILR